MPRWVGRPGQKEQRRESVKCSNDVLIGSNRRICSKTPEIPGMDDFPGEVPWGLLFWSWWVVSKNVCLCRHRVKQVDEQYLRDEFNAADGDGNGVLDVDELNELLKKMGYITDATWSTKDTNKRQRREKDFDRKDSSSVGVGEDSAFEVLLICLYLPMYVNIFGQPIQVRLQVSHHVPWHSWLSHIRWWKLWKPSAVPARALKPGSSVRPIWRKMNAMSEKDAPKINAIWQHHTISKDSRQVQCTYRKGATFPIQNDVDTLWYITRNTKKPQATGSVLWNLVSKCEMTWQYRPVLQFHSAMTVLGKTAALKVDLRRFEKMREHLRCTEGAEVQNSRR